MRGLNASGSYHRFVNRHHLSNNDDITSERSRAPRQCSKAGRRYTEVLLRPPQSSNGPIIIIIMSDERIGFTNEAASVAKRWRQNVKDDFVGNEDLCLSSIRKAVWVVVPAVAVAGSWKEENRRTLSNWSTRLYGRSIWSWIWTKQRHWRHAHILHIYEHKRCFAWRWQRMMTQCFRNEMKTVVQPLISVDGRVGPRKCSKLKICITVKSHYGDGRWEGGIYKRKWSACLWTTVARNRPLTVQIIQWCFFYPWHMHGHDYSWHRICSTRTKFN